MVLVSRILNSLNKFWTARSENTILASLRSHILVRNELLTQDTLALISDLNLTN